MTKNNEKQAYVPAGSIPVENPNGTAPSFIVEDPHGVIISLPGVPFEMKWLFDHRVIPYLREKFDLQEMIVSRVLKIAEIGESSVDDRIGHLHSPFHQSHRWCPGPPWPGRCAHFGEDG